MQHDPQAYITGVGLIALFILVFKGNKDNNDRVGRVYTRLDEDREEASDTFTRKDVCEIRHEQISKDLREIKTDVKTILNNGKK